MIDFEIIKDAPLDYNSPPFYKVHIRIVKIRVPLVHHFFVRTLMLFSTIQLISEYESVEAKIGIWENKISRF